MKTKDELEALIIEADRKMQELAAAERSHEKSRLANKKEFLKLSAERTKMELVEAKIDGEQAEAKHNLEQSINVLEANNAGAVAISEQARDIEALEKRTKASCRRKETAATKALDEAETLKAQAAESKSKYDAKYAKLKAAIDG